MVRYAVALSEAMPARALHTLLLLLLYFTELNNAIVLLPQLSYKTNFLIKKLLNHSSTLTFA
jgi:hypothetical protein